MEQQPMRKSVFTMAAPRQQSRGPRLPLGYSESGPALQALKMRSSSRGARVHLNRREEDRPIADRQNVAIELQCILPHAPRNHNVLLSALADKRKLQRAQVIVGRGQDRQIPRVHPVEEIRHVSLTACTTPVERFSERLNYVEKVSRVFIHGGHHVVHEALQKLEIVDAEALHHALPKTMTIVALLKQAVELGTHSRHSLNATRGTNVLFQEVQMTQERPNK